MCNYLNASKRNFIFSLIQEGGVLVKVFNKIIFLYYFNNMIKSIKVDKSLCLTNMLFSLLIHDRTYNSKADVALSDCIALEWYFRDERSWSFKYSLPFMSALQASTHEYDLSWLHQKNSSCGWVPSIKNYIKTIKLGDWICN